MKTTQWEHPVTGAKPGKAVTVPVKAKPRASSPQNVLPKSVDRAREKPEDSSKIETATEPLPAGDESSSGSAVEPGGGARIEDTHAT